jgi:hypothetical protein
MTRFLLCYLSEIDVEDVSGYSGWRELCDLSTHQYGTLDNPLTSKALFLQLLSQALMAPGEVYIQVIAHTTIEHKEIGICVREADRRSSLQSFISFAELASLFNGRSRNVHLNMMSVCASANSFIMDLPFKFLAVTNGKSISSEAIRDSCHVLDAIVKNDSSLLEQLQKTLNDYQFFYENKS